MPRQFKTLKTNSSSEVHSKLINSRASIAKCLLEFTRTPITKYTICVRKDFFCIPRLWLDQMDSRTGSKVSCFLIGLSTVISQCMLVDFFQDLSSQKLTIFKESQKAESQWMQRKKIESYFCRACSMNVTTGLQCLCLYFNTANLSHYFLWYHDCNIY